MLKAVLIAKVIDSKTGKPAKLAKKGTMTRTIQNTQAHLAKLQAEAPLSLGKHIADKFGVADWKTFNNQFKIVPKGTDKKAADSSNDDGNKSDDSDENKPKDNQHGGNSEKPQW